VHCLQNNIDVEVVFISDMKQLKKHMKHGDRIIFLDYGANINNECIATMCAPMPKGYQVMVFPAVKEGVDWALFKKKTLEGSKEPAEQRGLAFDTIIDKQFGDYLWSVTKTEAVVWVMDVKPVDKLIRGATIQEGFLDDIMKLGVKICACTQARCAMTYVHTCLANILETYGVTINR
jgi:hypothetical protein